MSAFSIRTQPFHLGWADYRPLWLAQWAWLALYAGLVPVALNLRDLLHGRYQTYLYIQLAVLVFCVTSAALSATLRWRRYRRDPVMTGERIMVLDAGAVRLIAYGCDTRLAWQTIGRIRQGQHHLFIHMRSRQVYVLPRRALSPDDIGRLLTAGRAAINAARQTKAALPPLPEAPDNRDLWRGRPYRMGFAVIYVRILTLAWPIAVLLLGLAMVGLTMDVWLEGIDGVNGLAWSGATLCMLGLLVAGLVLGGLIAGNRQDARGEREVCFTRDYVRCTGQAFDTRVDWANVRRVRRIAGVAVFHFGSAGRFDVPASAFANPAQATAFFTQAVAFWRAAEARR